MASTAADVNHGNSYLVWQNSSSIIIYESVSNTLNQRAIASLPAANGQTYQYRVTYSSAVARPSWVAGAGVRTAPLFSAVCHRRVAWCRQDGWQGASPVSGVWTPSA